MQPRQADDQNGRGDDADGSPDPPDRLIRRRIDRLVQANPLAVREILKRVFAEQTRRIPQQFDLPHARKVLAEFGRALGRLPPRPVGLTAEQGRFLDEAVAGLATDGKVIPVRLSLFAEMTRGKPWTSANLRALGGAEGIGVLFLEESLGPRAAHLVQTVRGIGYTVRSS